MMNLSVGGWLDRSGSHLSVTWVGGAGDRGSEWPVKERLMVAHTPRFPPEAAQPLLEECGCASPCFRDLHELVFSVSQNFRRQQAEKNQRALKIRRIQLDREKRERDIQLAKKRERKRRQKSHHTHQSVRRTVIQVLVVPVLTVFCIGAAMTLCSHVESIGKDTPFWQDTSARGTYQIVGPVVLCLSVVVLMTLYILYKQDASRGKRSRDDRGSRDSTDTKTVAISELPTRESDKTMTSLPLLVVHAPGDDGVKLSNGGLNSSPPHDRTKESITLSCDTLSNRNRRKIEEDTMVPVDALLLSYDCEELPAQDSSSTSHYKSVNNVDTQAASRESPTPAKQTDHCQYNTQQDDVITHVHSPDENTNSTGLA